jgi:hypothetical protein
VDDELSLDDCRRRRGDDSASLDDPRKRRVVDAAADAVVYNAAGSEIEEAGCKDGAEAGCGAVRE